MTSDSVSSVEALAPIYLDEPPEVVRLGVGRHGTTGLVDRFSLPELWSLHLYSYRATLTVEDRSFEIKPNDISLVPPATRIEYRYLGPSQHLYAHLRIQGQGTPRRLPLLWSAGAEAPILAALLRSAVEGFQASPLRSRSYVWAALWRLEALTEDGTAGQRNPYVAAAIAFLEAHLANPITVPEVARQVGISPNQLTRLFRAELGCTVVGYLRTARLTLADHLLRDSTMSIAAIATTVGIPDLQAFNKACRRVLGAPPRKVRSARSPVDS
jgi:AraC family transcriptional regulator